MSPATGILKYGLILLRRLRLGTMSVYMICDRRCKLSMRLKWCFGFHCQGFLGVLVHSNVVSLFPKTRVIGHRSFSESVLGPRGDRTLTLFTMLHLTLRFFSSKAKQIVSGINHKMTSNRPDQLDARISMPNVYGTLLYDYNICG